MVLRAVRRLFYLATLCILIISLPGCGVKVHLPTDKDFSMIRSGKRSIVLLRITSELDGKSYELFQHSVLEDNIGLALISFETGGEPQQIKAVFPSNRARKDGWIYLLLKSGDYYLAVQPAEIESKFRGTEYLSKFKSAPLYRFYIPSQTKLIYAGTLHFQSLSERFYFFDVKIVSSIREDSMIVYNEENAASNIAAEYFSEFGTPETILMQRHEGPIILKTPNMIE